MIGRHGLGGHRPLLPLPRASAVLELSHSVQARPCGQTLQPECQNKRCHYKQSKSKCMAVSRDLCLVCSRCIALRCSSVSRRETYGRNETSGAFVVPSSPAGKLWRA